MTSAFHRARPDSPADQWSNETSVVAKLRPPNLKDWPRPSPRKRRSRRLLRVLITFCIGVAATLAWQSFGDQARQVVADSSPVLGWLAPRVPVAQVLSDQLVATQPTTSSHDLQQLKAMSPDLAAVRQSVDELVAKLQQMADDVATMRTAQQTILRKVSTPSPPSPPPPRPAAGRDAVRN